MEQRCVRSGRVSSRAAGAGRTAIKRSAHPGMAKTGGLKQGNFWHGPFTSGRLCCHNFGSSLLIMRRLHVTNLIIVSTLALVFSSECRAKVNAPPPKSCSKLSGWMSRDFPAPEPGYYIPIAARSASFVLMRRSVVHESGLRSYLLRARSEVYPTQPIYLFSSAALSCSAFKRAAAIINSAYLCSEQRPCVWGYRLGEDARPSNVPAPLSPRRAAAK